MTAADAAYDDHYGMAVSINGGYALVGNPEYDEYGSRSGAVYFYALPTPTVTISADPGVIQVGGSATLAWTSEEANSCVIEPGIGGVGAEGSTVVQPTQTTTYAITAAGALDTATDTATVYVYDPNAPLTLSATADPVSIQGGHSTTVTWHSTNATSCVIEPGIGPVHISGSITLSPTETTTYTITAANPVATTTETVTISVNYLPPAVSISSSPKFIESGETSTLTWSATNATSCVIEPGIGSVDLNGSITVSPIGTTTYIITAANPGGSATEAVTVTVILPPPISEFKLTADDGKSDDSFGDSVSISGDYIIVGAQRQDDFGISSGAAYIYNHQDTSWSQQSKLTADDAAEGDSFASSVAIGGDYVIVGSPGDRVNGFLSGSAYIFKRDDSSWIQEVKLIADEVEPYDYFGCSVAISGEYAVAGAFQDDDGGNNVGAAYVFKHNGSNWIRQAKLIANEIEPYGYFGYSVAIDGDYVIAGARDDEHAGFLQSGAAYVFTRSGSDWTEQAKLTADDAASEDHFGKSVSIGGNYAIVGAPEKDSAGVFWSGAAYIFKREGTSWIQQVKLTPDDPAEKQHFGYSVSMDGDYAAVGAFGDTHAGDYSGAVYLFKREGSNWIQIAKQTASDAAERDYLGISAALSGDRLIAGADKADTHVDDVGAAYIFNFPAPVVDISANPTVIALGGSANLTWSSRNVDTVSIEPGISEIEVNGSISVSPNQTTTYTITATGTEGTVTDNVTVYVYDPSAPITVSAAADPVIIQGGQSTTLTWSTANATSCVIEPGIGSVDLNGSIAVSPAQTTTYTITAANPVGSTSAMVTVTVSLIPPTAENQSITISEDTPVDVAMQASDSAGRTLTYMIVNGPTKGMLSDDDGDSLLTYTPNAEFAGGDTFTFKVNNGYSDSNVATVSITVEAVNDPPMANEDPATTAATVAVDIDVLTNDTDADGDALSVTSFTQPQAGAVADNGGGILTYTPVVGFNGTDNFTYTITDGHGAGIQGLVTVFVASPIALEITSPLVGEWIYRPDVMVQGIFSNTAGIETGVTVNGAVALVYGGQFVANHVPLVEGQNTITAEATDMHGYTATGEITVHVETAGDFIRITADTESGVSFFETDMTVEGSFDFVSDPGISDNGPDDVDYLDSLGDDRYNIGISTPGIYYISAEATDEEARVYTDTVALLVLDPAIMDTMLSAKWNGMKSALVSGNINDALNFFTYPSRGEYEQIFSILSGQMPNIAENMEDIQLVYANDTVAKYRIRKDEMIDGQNYRVTYYIHFDERQL